MELQANNVFYYILLLSENWNWNYKRICLNEFLFERIQERWGSKRPNQDYKLQAGQAFVGESKLPLMDILFWHHSDSDKDNDIILKDPKVFERWLAA